MNRPPAFQLYVKDWLTSKKRAAMDLDQQAAYLNLLCHCWDTDDCALPDDPAILAALSELREHWNTRSTPVQQAFEPHPKKPGFVTNMRLYSEHQKYRRIQKERRLAGRESGVSRRNHRGNDAEHMFSKRSTSVDQMPNSASASSLNSYREKKASRGEVELNGHGLSFDVFWAAYPKHEGKKLCRQWWAKHMPDDVLLGVMLSKIEQAKQTKKWNDQGGDFIPMPLTWLNGERWEDEHLAVRRKELLPL